MLASVGLLLTLALRLVIKVPAVQTWLVRQATTYLSDQLHTEVKVEAVDIRIFRSILLRGVLIRDLQKDTLLYTKELTARFNQFNFRERKIGFSRIRLDQATIGIKRYRKPRDYNFDFLVDYFSSPVRDTTASRPWALKVASIELADCHLRYRDFKHIDPEQGIDWEDVELFALNANVSQLIPMGDSLSFKVDQLSFVERSGFVLEDMQTAVVITPQQMKYDALRILTPRSLIDADLSLNYDSIADFEEFITNVRCKAQFRSSRIDFRDLSFFADELRNLNRALNFSGKVSGTVARFKARDMVIGYTGQTYFKGNVNMTGLPDFEETYMEVEVKELAVKTSQLNTLPVWPFDTLKLLNMPQEVMRLGDVSFKGRFNGFYNDFVAYGNINTSLGYATTDLNLKIGQDDRKSSYKGSLTLFDFGLGKLLGLEPDLGKVSMRTKLEGKGFDFAHINANMEGEVSRIDLMGYPYTNIRLNGHLSNKLFNGDLSIADPNLELDFQGEVDFREKLPVFDFSSAINRADLTALKLLKREEHGILSAELNINLTGNTPDNAQGNIMIEDIVYREGRKEIRSEGIRIESVIGEERILNLNSDILDVNLKGRFNVQGLVSSFANLIANFIPAITDQASNRPPDQMFQVRAELKRTGDILDIFVPGLEIAGGTIMEGSMNTNANNFALLFSSRTIRYEGIEADSLHIDGHTSGELLLFRSHIAKVDISDSLKLYNAEVSGFANHDTASFYIDLKGADSTRSAVRGRINAGFLTTGYTAIKLFPEKLINHGVTWDIDPRNYLLADSTGIFCSNLILTADSSRISINGMAGKDPTAVLEVKLEDFQVSQLNSVLDYYDASVRGKAEGEIEIAALFGRPSFNADLNVEELYWFSDYLGDAELKAEFDTETERLNVKGVVTRGGSRNISVEGYYQRGKYEDELNFTAELSKTYINSFSYYLEGLASGLSGLASGSIQLKGTVRNPELTGKIYLQKVAFTVDYLKTRYSFSTEVEIRPGAFKFKDVVLNDFKGNQAVVNGSITHDHFRDFYFDIGIHAKNVQVLNTGPADNDLFYGVAYSTGTMTIKGYLDYLFLEMGMKSEKGTKINIPLSNPEEVSRSNFITFITKEDTVKAIVADAKEFTGIALKMDLEVTPDASIYLIFDSKIGDVIEGKGYGNLTMTMSPTEDFRMFGNFQIEQGNYLFTMQNIVNKPFVLDKGGTIRWAGDPYDATIDISAAYRLRATLFDLLQDSSYRNLVPVDLRLRLKDNLFNPSINFDINVVNVDPNLENQIRRLINTDEEKYRQAVALLVMRRFTTPSEFNSRATVNSGSVVGANAYEMLSNQLSNWASQISQQVNVGVNYRPGDNISSEELEVALSTSLFNDRVTIDGNVGYANTGVNSQNQNTTNLVGDFNVEWKASRDGRTRFKAFNRSNNNSLINNVNSPYTQGVGVFYREEFNTWSDLGRKIRNIFRKKSKRTPVNLPARQ